jgi:O-acetyl-ADP-ribose deacetylase (regulator of RNase III)
MSTAGTRRSGEGSRPIWTHPSVAALGGGKDPLTAIATMARETAFRAIQSGWSGPPYDPFALAEFLKISVEPSQEVVDARTLPATGGRFKIEFNPNRSAARINFSVAHEIAHTLFPDCARAIRNRSTHVEPGTDDWQLEVLCNVGAAEILMPVGSFRIPDNAALSIDTVIDLQREFAVSSEAVLLRIAKLTPEQCFIFAAHRQEDHSHPIYRVDYTASSRNWQVPIYTGFKLPATSVAAQCTAIGFTAKTAKEVWLPGSGPWRVECLGIAPYPGHVYPRVVGIVRPIEKSAPTMPSMEYLVGDATKPRGTGTKIVAQVVNDKALTWGKGFSVAVRKRWPHAQKDFTNWILTSRQEFKLGNTHSARLDDSTELASLVAQHGYGPSLFPRIEYSALESCLSKVAVLARERQASVHMPRIATGEARGDWKIISEIIDETLCRAGVAVFVYDLPTVTRRVEYTNLGPRTTN